MKEYRKHLYNVCSETNLGDREDVTRTIQYLAAEANKYHDLSMRFEDKLKELMSYKDFAELSKEIAKEMFLQDVTAMPDSDFKDFVIQNMGDILDDAGEGDDDGHNDVCGE